MKNNMVFLCVSVLYCVVLSTNMGVSDAITHFKVGESIGWRMPDENDTAVYSQWAAKNRFLVGDSLYFEYKNDSVLQVNKGGYYHCNITNPNSTFTDGKTVIRLQNPGPAYFISGTPDHCMKGQRLLVDVMTLHPPTPPSSPPPSPPSPSIASPPESYIPTSPAPSPHHSSGVVAVAVTSVSILVALATTIIMLSWGAQ